MPFLHEYDVVNSKICPFFIVSNMIFESLLTISGDTRDSVENSIEIKSREHKNEPILSLFTTTDGIPNELCLGATCMMWRYKDPDLKLYNVDKGCYGYCGLAGRPLDGQVLPNDDEDE